MTTVRGTIALSWSVTLPKDKAGVPGPDDPAIDALIQFIPQSGWVHCFDNDIDRAEIWLEISDTDIEIEEDERPEGKQDEQN